jgi:hypothetical protein
MHVRGLAADITTGKGQFAVRKTVCRDLNDGHTANIGKETRQTETSGK